MVCAIDHWACANTCPLCNVFRCSCVSIVASTIEECGKLDVNGNLWVIRPWCKNWTCADFIQDTVKDFRIYMDLFLKQMQLKFCKNFEEVQLGCMHQWCRHLLHNVSTCNIITKWLDCTKQTVVVHFPHNCWISWLCWLCVWSIASEEGWDEWGRGKDNESCLRVHWFIRQFIIVTVQETDLLFSIVYLPGSTSDSPLTFMITVMFFTDTFHYTVQ